MLARMSYELRVERGLKNLGPFDQATSDAILEIAYLTVAVDQELRPEEVSACGKVWRALGAGSQDDRGVAQKLDSYPKDLDRDAILQRLEVCAKRLGEDRKAKLTAYRIATLMAMSDLDAAHSEFEFDLDLIAALGLEQAEADEVLAEVNAALMPPGT